MGTTTGLENTSKPMARFMRANGRMINGMAKVSGLNPTEKYVKVSLKEASLKVIYE